MDKIRNPFPNLGIPRKTSEATSRYNCIAWAFRDNTKWWWPARRAFWPIAYKNLSTLEAFQLWFEHDGWAACDADTLETELEKVALFADNDGPTHAARQLPNGDWTSKLGQDIDIAHSLYELEGPAYGSVIAIYSKRLTTIT